MSADPSSPKRQRKKKHAKSQKPHDVAKRRARFLEDTDVQAMLKEAREIADDEREECESVRETNAHFRKLLKCQEAEISGLQEQFQALGALFKKSQASCIEVIERNEKLTYNEGFHAGRIDVLKTENNELRCKLAERSGRKHTGKKVGRPAKALEEKSGEEKLKEGMEKNFEDAEKVVRKRHMDRMEHDLKVLREQQYFATDEVALAAQAERVNGGTGSESDMKMSD